jgi:hypothetical protein
VSGPGGTSVRSSRGNFKNAVADDVRRLDRLDVDSPGGSVYGISELADAILSRARLEAVIAVANSTRRERRLLARLGRASSSSRRAARSARSASSPSTRTIPRPRGEGRQDHLISAGKYKAEGYGPLDAEAATLQVARRRLLRRWSKPSPPAAACADRAGARRLRRGPRARRAARAEGRMVDGVIATLDEVIGRRWPRACGGQGGRTRPRAAELRERDL